MKATKITYERLVNTGNFSHERYGIEIEIESKDESVTQAYEAAKRAIKRQIIGEPDEHAMKIYEQVKAYHEEDFVF